MSSQSVIQLGKLAGDGYGELAPQLSQPPAAYSSLCLRPTDWILDDGSLSPCFVDGPLQLIPSLVLALIAPFVIYNLRQKPRSRLGSKPWFVVGNLMFIQIQMALFAAMALYCFWIFGLDVRSITPGINALVLTLSLAIHVLEHGRTVVPNGLMLMYWPLSIILTGIKVYNMYMNSRYQMHSYFMMVCSSLCIQIVDYVIPKRLNRQSKDSTLLESADIYSNISLSWMNPVIMQASEASLTSEHLPDIDSTFNTSQYSGKFARHWANRKDDSPKSIWLALGKSFGPTLGIAAMFEFFYDSSRYLHPILLQYLILYARSHWEDQTPQPMSVGFYIAMAMFVTAVVRTVLGSNTSLYGLRTACGVRSSLMNAVYRKSLALSAKEREHRSTGEIVNIMAVDVLTITSMCMNITVLWEAPLEFILCMFSLNRLMGASMWSIFAVLCFFLPSNWFLTRFIKKMRKLQMKYKDQRTRLTTEIMTNVKSLKLYGWEDALLNRLDHVRNELQLQNLKRLIFIGSGLEFVWSIVPFCFSCATFALFVYLNDIPLTSDVVFPAMSLFNMVTGPISEIPRMMTQFIDCGVSINRLRDLLCSEELEDQVERHPAAQSPGDVSLVIEDGTFHWDRHGDPILENINLTAHKGELACIVGRVGAGKSSLLKCILSELHTSKGQIQVMGTLAYVSQDPWLMNATVKENIVFGNRFEPEFYKKTIEACALVQDLEVLPDGDNTEIGERGVSLSGGQKARLSLARAVYARSDVYLMDDPLSAVDEHVGGHIIRHVLSSHGLLADKTRILCTNAINVLSRADRVMLLENKTISESGTVNEVMAQRGHIYDLIKEFGREHDHGSMDDATDLVQSDTEVSESESDTLASSLELESDQTKPLLRKLNNQQRTNKVKESSQVGRVKWDVYKKYAAACGWVALTLSFVIIASSSLVALGTNFWLKDWVESNAKHGYNANPGYWIGGYLCLGVFGAFMVVLRRVVTRAFGGLRASKSLHDTMARRVLASPMSFFETTPVGRIINRFSSDINELDEGLPSAFVDMVRTIFKLFLSMTVVIVSAPVVLVIVAPLSALYYYYQRYYQSASREIKRLMSISRSPIFSHFQESLNGVSTIRAFGQHDRFLSYNEQNIDVNIRAIFLFRSTNRWLSFRLQTIGAAIVLATACTIVVGSARQAFSPGLIGIMMTYTLEVTDHLSHIVRAIVNLETSIVGVERVLEYCELPSEAPAIVGDNRPPAYWPTDGKIKFKNYSTKYRADLDPILNNVSFDISPRKKVGVVGRTGAGKTSLVMSLFRIIEPTQGSIEIDDIDVTKIGLHDLRSNLAIIPQDSQILVGTVRENLDPFTQHSDVDIWRALRLAHLADYISSMPGGLDAAVSEGGQNLSSGQRQLMCLSRALLHDSSVLVLDEATASVDVQTDKLVQETIRSEFKHKTLVTIAHRLHSVMDSDQIIVLDRGEVAEVGPPQTLLADSGSKFYALCKEGGFVI